jgi:DNA-binding transcriptional MocR family regulator
MARKYDILIACDDVYNLLVYDGQCSPKRLFEYDNFEDVDFKGHVISNGSFSKILAPGIRFGCMECPPRIVDVFRDSGILKSGGCANNYTAGIVSSLIELGLAQEHLNFYIEKYKDGRDALCKELLELPEEVTFTKPAGGYFVWVKFPEHIDCSKFNEFCLKNFKVFGIPGERFSVQGDSKNFLRLSFSFHDAANMAEAGRRLCAAAKEYLSKNST